MSDEEKNIEQIRDLLRQKLEGSEPADDGWNLPSGKVWEGLSGELTAGRESRQASRRSRWLKAALGVLLVILLFRECAHLGQVDALKSENEQLQDAYDKLEQSCNEKQPPETAPGGSGGGQQQPGQAPVFGQATPPAEPPPRVKKQLLTTAATPASLAFSEARTSDAPSEIQPEKTDLLAATLSADSFFFRANTPAHSLLPAIPTALFEREPTAPKPDLRLPESLSSAHAGVRFRMSASGGLALTGNRIRGERPAIIARQKALLSWQTGLGLEAVFSPHWSLETGLRYSVSRLQTDYRLEVPFTHNNEFQHDDGNFDNTYNHSLPSSLGNYPAQFILTRESTATVPEGEVMNLDLRIRQHTALLSLPFHLRYGIGKKQWQAGIRAGVVVNRTLAVAAEDAPELVSHHSAIHQRHTSIGNPSLDDLQKMTFDASLGSDLRYQLSSRLSLSVVAALQMGLTPIYEDETVRNYLREASLGFGFQYWLH